MPVKINGKTLMECTESDLQVIIDNPDYRENEYIDYKQNFSFLEIDKGKEKNNKINEFKNDICAFANGQGGYLIYGVSDVNGCASQIPGIEIPNDNTDSFELDRRNNLVSINPKTPNLKFHFIKLTNGKYVVVIKVKHDGFSPYVHLEEQKNYKIYKRVGNRKQVMSYAEVKKMFIQSMDMDKEIKNYRNERINSYLSQEDTDDFAYSKFLLFHIVPETFLDSNYDNNIFILNKSRQLNCEGMFSEFYCSSAGIPCVDGLRFVSGHDYCKYSESRIFNNGIAECFFPLYNEINFDSRQNPEGYFPHMYFWEKIQKTLENYFTVFKNTYSNERIYVCISIVGCKDVTSENKDFLLFYKGKIDRNLLLCNPVVVEGLDDLDNVERSIKKLQVEYMLSLGIKNNDSLNLIIKELYGV